jgi:hypothetical protein
MQQQVRSGSQPVRLLHTTSRPRPSPVLPFYYARPWRITSQRGHRIALRSTAICFTVVCHLMNHPVHPGPQDIESLSSAYSRSTMQGTRGSTPADANTSNSPPSPSPSTQNTVGKSAKAHHITRWGFKKSVSNTAASDTVDNSAYP